MTTTITPAPPAQDRVAAMRPAQQAWAALRVGERLRPVRTLRHLFVTECDGLCAAVARDLGKPSEETVAGEVLPLP